MLAFNQGTTLCVAVALLFLAECSATLFNLLLGILGLATASNSATTMLWAEEHVVVTGWISSGFGVSVALGTQVFSVLIGQFVESHPMVLMHLLFAVSVCGVLLFAAAYCLAASKRGDDDDLKSDYDHKS